MGFTAAAIVTTNVPEKLDPLKYLTMPSQTKAQEQAQAQAQALAYGKLHGMSVSELERVIYGAASTRSQEFKQLSHEEQNELQDAKVPVIPSRVDPPAEVHYTQVDYPYLFTNSRVRPFYQSIEVSRNLGQPRSSSQVGRVQAPTFTPSEDELAAGSQYISVINQELEKYGIVKVQFPAKWSHARIPFGLDQPAFRTQRQTVLNPGLKPDFSLARRGFFRALIRFHMKTPQKRRLQKLPTLERKPVDYFRLFLLVERRGGAEAVAKRKEWAQVGRELGFSTNTSPTLSSVIRQLYNRILQPLKTWLDIELPMRIDFRKLLRIDVDDEGESKWHRLPFGIIINLENTHTAVMERQVFNLDDLRFMPAFSTLRLFRQKYLAEDLQERSVEELEAEFAALSEFYESEHIFPKPKLYKQSKESLTTISGEPTKDHEFLDPWDFTALALRGNTAFFPFIIDQDLDDLVVPELDVGNRFATQTWYRPKAGTYEANMVVSGKSRTWYTKQGVWADQDSSEIIIVHPSTEVMNWCHGVSSMVSTNILLDSNWLMNACALDAQPDNHVCVQQIVYEAAYSKEPIESCVKQQILTALQILKERELTLLSRLSNFDVEKRVIPGQPPVTCARSRRRRYFSWILVNGEPWSLEAFWDEQLARRDKSADAVEGQGAETHNQSRPRVICKYEDPNAFFDELIQRIKTREETPRWEKAVNTEISELTEWLPAESTLLKLRDQAPSKFSLFAIQLSAAVDKLHLYLQYEGSFANFNELVECSDVNHVSQTTHRGLIQKLREADLLYLEIVNALASPEDEGGVSVSRIEEIAETLSQQYRSCFSMETIKVLQSFPAIREWVQNVVAVLRKKPVATLRNELMELRRQSELFGSFPRCKPVDLLIEALQKTNEPQDKLSEVLAEISDTTPALILRYKAIYIDPNGGFDKMTDVDPVMLSHFRLMYENLTIFERMLDPSFLNRPRRGELADLLVIPAVSRVSAQLDSWLKDAKDLDWNAIAMKIHLLSSGAPPQEPFVTLVSVSNIARVYTNLFSLRCVPDDVESVYRTFQNTVTRLTTTPMMVLHQYGFFP